MNGFLDLLYEHETLDKRKLSEGMYQNNGIEVMQLIVGMQIFNWAIPRALLSLKSH